MQVYTTYFAQLRKIPADKVLPVAICLYTPQWYSGVVYKKLAPTAKMLSAYKETKDVIRFQEQYTKQILSKYNVPIIMDADVGHFAPMMPLICGSYAEVEVQRNQIEIEMK